MLPYSTANRKTPKRKTKDGKSGLNKEVIVAKALEIIDREGIQTFSIRGLAKALEIYPTAIYWHVPNLNALIGEVIALVLKDLVPDNLDADWRAGFRGLFENYRARIREHPNVAPLIGAQLVSNMALDFDMVEQIMRALKQAGFADAKLVAAYNAVIATMVGFTTQEFALVPADKEGEWPQSMRAAIESFDKNRYPTVAEQLPKLMNRAFIMRWENGATAPLDEGFTIFVDAFILGIERLASTQAQ